MKIVIRGALILFVTLAAAFALTVSGSPPQGTVGTAYSYSFTATGGAAPYTFSAIGLPAGLSLSAAGVVSGTPTAAVQDFPSSIVVTDSTNAKASITVLFQIGKSAPGGPLAIDQSSALPVGSVGVPYMQTITVSGGKLPYTGFSIVGGAVPSGLIFAAAGGNGPSSAVIRGIPDTPGTYTFTAQVSDSAGSLASKTFTLVISNFVLTGGGPGVLDTSGTVYYPLASGSVGAAYSQAIAATGGTPPYTYSLAAGSLPPGLMVNGSGILTGTPSAASSFSFTLQANDSASLMTQKSYTVMIFPAGPRVLNAALPDATVGVAYSQTLMATAGTPPYSFAVSAGALPAGLTLSAGGVISGTPTAPGFNVPITIQVTDGASTRGTQAFTLTVHPSPLTITNPSILPAAALGAAYSQTLVATGGLPPYQFGLVSGSVPPGFTLSPAGTLAGTPTAAGTFTFTVGVLDTPGSTGFGLSTANKTFTLVVRAVPLSITTAPALAAGTTGMAYSQTLTASGGKAPYSFAVTSGALPAGLTLSASGVIGGTPTTAGNFIFGVKIIDSNSQTATQTFSLSIGSSLTISTGSVLPGATVGSAYSQALTATGAGPFSYGLASGSLPAGLTLSGAGVLSGTPIAAGAFNFSVQVTDSTSASVMKSFSLMVSPAALTITTGTTLPPGSVDQPYSQTLAASGGAPPYSFALTGCCLPNGLGLSSGGVLSGSPKPAGSYNFTVAVTDSASITMSKMFTLQINPSAIAIATPATLPSATAGVPYSVTFASSGGTGMGLGFSATSGSAPPGLSFDTQSLSGTPTTAGAYTFTLTFADSGAAPVSMTFNLTVNPAGLAITNASQLPSGMVGTAYSQTINATAGTAPYTFALTSGSLPNGLTLAPNGALSGTPTAPGQFAFTLQVTDGAGITAVQTFTLTIGATPLSIVALSLPGGRAGTAYSQALTATGGTPPYMFAIASGTLPSGISLSTAGALSGTPTAPGNFGFTVQVSDSAGMVNAKSFSIAISPAGLTISPPSPLPLAALGAAYSQTLSAAGGTPPYNFAVMSGTLPAGLALTSAGVLSGMPTTAGTFNFTVTVGDSASQSAAMAYSLIVGGTAFTISTLPALPAGSLGLAYLVNLGASGGTPPYSFTLAAGVLPAGLTVSSAGLVTGTPTATGTFNFSVQATDSSGAVANQSFTITIGAAGLQISTASLPNGSMGIAYSQNLAAIGGTAPYRFAVSAGILPTGIALSSGGLLSGTPTTAGAFNFTVSATDAAGLTNTKALTITIAGASLSITSASTLLAGTQGNSYSQTLTAAGGNAPYSWAVIAGALPAGLILNGSGVLIGTPSAAGIFSFTVQVTDSTGMKAVQTVTLVVAGPAVASPLITAIVNAASYSLGAVAPGEIVTIFGTALGPASIVTAQASNPGFLDKALAQTRVLFDGISSALIYTLDRQVSAIVPYGVAGKAITRVQVEYQGVLSPAVSLAVADSAPGLFAADASGRGPGAILNQDFSLNSASNPAAIGSVVMLYATGEGSTDPDGIDGKIATAPLPVPKLPVMVTVGGVPARVLYAGGAPGIVAGGVQLNVEIPEGVLPGDAVQVVATIGSGATQSGVTLAIR